jgi:hypothetical protein
MRKEHCITVQAALIFFTKRLHSQALTAHTILVTITLRYL